MVGFSLVSLVLHATLHRTPAECPGIPQSNIFSFLNLGRFYGLNDEFALS